MSGLAPPGMDTPARTHPPIFYSSVNTSLTMKFSGIAAVERPTTAQPSATEDRIVGEISSSSALASS